MSLNFLAPFAPKTLLCAMESNIWTEAVISVRCLSPASQGQFSPCLARILAAEYTGRNMDLCCNIHYCQRTYKKMASGWEPEDIPRRNQLSWFVHLLKATGKGKSSEEKGMGRGKIGSCCSGLSNLCRRRWIPAEPGSTTPSPCKVWWYCGQTLSTLKMWLLWRWMIEASWKVCGWWGCGNRIAPAANFVFV